MFGDLNDARAAWSKLKQQERNYGLLEDLGHAAAHDVSGDGRNPNPALGVIGDSTDRRVDGAALTWTAIPSIPKATSERRCRSSRRGTAIRSITDKLTAIVLTQNTPLAWFVVTGIGFIAPDGA